MMSRNQDFDLLKPVQSSPPRPRHQIRRSITELSSPIKLPRYHHLHHLRKDRDNDDHTPMSAGPMLHLTRGSFELPRSEGTTPYANSESGLRISMLSSAFDDATRNAGPTTSQPPSMNQEELIREEKEKVASKLVGLRKSLVELNTFSNATTRRLDDTYYAVLEKLSVLQSTIVALKELAAMSQELNESFEVESQELVNELEQQADSFGQFDDQQERIEELQGRVRAGRGKVEALSKRVDVVRDRIESWERADNEWQERTRKRLKIIWIITSVVIFSLIFLLVGAQYAPSSEDVSTLTISTPVSGQEHGEPVIGEAVSNQSESVAAMVDGVKQALNARRGEPAEDDVFRAFDEL
ncbi:uncharacterized protein F4822DRAFT_417255 [Hypoxylon trugodes]|uniref:uncharacterized protein n=1 Tax=Hypoxylon trugodes TaxID=326681 RepID=UPI00218DF9D1|nr:uncharacterized protein F4822DRAFT_417255 [Hypoxylon trugodes]KAI1385087.1 hypothetical protein F4822DRAFT_417255 [Hypoxylon trugodes]